MSHAALLTILFVASIGLTVRAEAQDAATIADARCVVVGMQIYDSTDSTKQASGMWLTLYYIGQLRGRTPQLDIENLLVEEARKMTDSDFNFGSCGGG